MALADILERIRNDAQEQATTLVAEADRRAEAIVAEARAEATARGIAVRESGQREADSSAETVIAGARLRARDGDVAARRELIERVLSEAVDTVVSLPEDRYTAFIARGIVNAARGGERVVVAPADRERLAGLQAAVETAAREEGRELSLDYTQAETDDAAITGVEHGVVLQASRMRIEVSPAAELAARRDELTMRASAELFGEGV